MFILFTLGRSLLISVFVVFLVLKNTLVKKKDKFLVDPDPNLLNTKGKQARQSDSTCSNATCSAVSVSSDGNSASFPQNG